MNVKKFRTRTEFIERNNGSVDTMWPIGLDIGFSGIKVFSPNVISCVPSYARRVDDDFSFAAGDPAEAIIYMDLETEQKWLVGKFAQETMSTRNISESESSLYGRDRYYSEMFLVLARTGLGLGCKAYPTDDAGVQINYSYLSDKRVILPSYSPADTIYIQTGLPERYMDDASSLTEVLSGEHRFALKIGNEDWRIFNIDVNAENIDVMSQPKGTLFSVCMNKDGSWHPDAKKYLTGSILVFDSGFGTLDLFPILSGVVEVGETFTNLGMKRILQETVKKIKAAYNVDIPVPAMQKILEQGVVRRMNKKTFDSEEVSFEEFLEQARNEVFEEAIVKLSSSIELVDYEYMIITGGTSAAWKNLIHEKFKNLKTLKILDGNQNDNLPYIYSNVRGYFMYRLNNLKRG